MHTIHTHSEGQLRHKETGEPFVFVVKEGDQRYNQAHYEALGEVTVGVVVTHTVLMFSFLCR